MVTPETHTSVYLNGDNQPVVVPLTVDEVLAKVADIELLNVGTAFVKLPLEDGKEACVRAAAISVVLPSYPQDTDDEDDDE